MLKTQFSRPFVFISNAVLLLSLQVLLNHPAKADTSWNNLPKELKVLILSLTHAHDHNQLMRMNHEAYRMLKDGTVGRALAEKLGRNLVPGTQAYRLFHRNYLVDYLPFILEKRLNVYLYGMNGVPRDLIGYRRLLEQAIRLGSNPAWKRKVNALSYGERGYNKDVRAAHEMILGDVARGRAIAARTYYLALKDGHHGINSDPEMAEEFLKSEIDRGSAWAFDEKLDFLLASPQPPRNLATRNFIERGAAVKIPRFMMKKVRALFGDYYGFEKNVAEGEWIWEEGLKVNAEWAYRLALHEDPDAGIASGLGNKNTDEMLKRAIDLGFSWAAKKRFYKDRGLKVHSSDLELQKYIDLGHEWAIRLKFELIQAENSYNQMQASEEIIRIIDQEIQKAVEALL